MFKRRFLHISLMTLVLGLGAVGCGPFADTAVPTAPPAVAVLPTATPTIAPAGPTIAVAEPTPPPAATGGAADTPGGLVVGQTRAIKKVTSGLEKLKSYRAHAAYAFDGKDKAGSPSKGSYDLMREVINATQDEHLKIAFTGNPLRPAVDSATSGTPYAYEMYRVGGNLFVINQGKCEFHESGASAIPGALDSLDTFIAVDKATLIRRGELVNGFESDHYTFTEAALDTSLNGMTLTQGDAWIAPAGFVVKVSAHAAGKTTEGAEGAVSYSYNLEDVDKLPSIIQPADCVVSVQAADIPVPPNATEKRLFEGGGLAGIAFKSPDPIKMVADFYRQAMPAQGWQPAGDKARAEPRILLTFTKDGGRRTVMIDLSGQGALSYALITDKKSQQGADIPVPPNATDKRLLEGGGQTSITFKSPDPIKTVADFYRQAMPKYEWKPAGDKPSGTNSIQLTFTKDGGKRTVMIDLSRQGAVSYALITDKKSQ